MKTWFIVLMLFIFFPIGIFLMYKYSNWNKVLKGSLTLFFLVCFIAGFAGTPKKNSTLTTQEKVSTSTPTTQEKVMSATEKIAAEKSSEDNRKAELQKKANSYFSPWDGSHRDLERSIKNSMNDPDSYEHVETTFGINYDTEELTVVTKFRGKNAFGGKVINSAKMTQNIRSGKILSVTKL